MYESMRNFDLMLENSHSLSVTNTLQVYLNLDLTKNPQSTPEKLAIKINTINRMMKIIDDGIETERKNDRKQDSENYFGTLRV